MLNYNLTYYTGLQLKDIARQKGLKVTFNMSKLQVIELLEKYQKSLINKK